MAFDTLWASIGFYLRHFLVLTAVSLLPALERFVYFLTGGKVSGALLGTLEAVVGLFRLLLLGVVLYYLMPGLFSRWIPGGGSGSKTAASPNLGFVWPNWTDLIWHVVLYVLVALILNLAASAISNYLVVPLASGGPEHAAAQSSHLGEAVRFAIKNLFIIPFTVVLMLISMLKLFFGS